MDKWTEVCRSVLTGELSKRQACKRYNIHWETLQKILANPEPPQKRRQGERRRPVLGPYLERSTRFWKRTRKPPKSSGIRRSEFERLHDE